MNCWAAILHDDQSIRRLVGNCPALRGNTRIQLFEISQQTNIQLLVKLYSVFMLCKMCCFEFAISSDQHGVENKRHLCLLSPKQDFHPSPLSYTLAFQVLNLHGWYFLTTEYLEFQHCIKKLAVWFYDILDQLDLVF
ncbi:hypothetical protein QQF64_031680 [Cirrhinus molitorella]|uniref:DUF6729 domain-containing protein n=1 Tax=Cirrhinus molitorella TaxID=172907 RepID=A0ABR3MXS4_9TELE